ncbi:hypothetical protein [Cellvibrio mixtus]|uniref:hypothetical protein n=1 Tax=Cellvibrio mixtus TaxID=39650 RepID=UPI0005879410|nr:hypothetical protein [Cellvibrio mixtus]
MLLAAWLKDFHVRLLYRKEKHVDENFFDYVSRLAYWNGYSSEKIFSDKLILLFKRKFPDRSFYVEKTQKIITMIEFLIEKEINYSQLNLSIFRKVNSEFHICPICWEENGYIRFYWRYENYLVCHIHIANMQKVSELDYGGQIACMVTDESVKPNYSCLILMRSVAVFSKSDGAPDMVKMEVQINYIMIGMVKLICNVFISLFDVYLHDKIIISALKNGYFVGLSISKKMEKMFTKLLYGNNKYRVDLQGLVMILIDSNPIFLSGQAGREFHEWLTSEGFSTKLSIENFLNGGLFFEHYNFKKSKENLIRYKFSI